MSIFNTTVKYNFDDVNTEKSTDASDNFWIVSHGSESGQIFFVASFEPWHCFNLSIKKNK